MAVVSLVESGIHQQIEKEITTSKAYRGLFDIFWVREQLRQNKPLTNDHLTPAFILLGLGLIPSTAVFFLELVHLLCKKKKATKDSVSYERTFSKKDIDNHESGKHERGREISLKHSLLILSYLKEIQILRIMIHSHIKR